jgi:hypothetical protein
LVTSTGLLSSPPHDVNLGLSPLGGAIVEITLNFGDFGATARGFTISKVLFVGVTSLQWPDLFPSCLLLFWLALLIWNSFLSLS